MGCHSLEHGSRAGGCVHAIGKSDESLLWRGHEFGIRAGHPGVGHAVPQLEFGDFRTQSRHRAGGLEAGNKGQVERIEARAVVGVYIVQTNGFDFDQYFTRAGLRIRDFLIA